MSLLFKAREDIEAKPKIFNGETYATLVAWMVIVDWFYYHWFSTCDSYSLASDDEATLRVNHLLIRLDKVMSDSKEAVTVLELMIICGLRTWCL